MIKHLVLLATLFVALFVWDRRLTSGERIERTESMRIGRLVSSDEEARLQGKLAAIELARGDKSWVYLPSRSDDWRCLGHHGAPAADRAVRAVLDSLTGAEGVVQSTDRSRGAEFGFRPGSSWRVTLHGASAIDRSGDQPVFRGDPLYRVDVGFAIAGRDGCYAREVGSDEVWAVDTNPLAQLEPSGVPAEPPLLDPGLVPAAWPGTPGRVEHVAIEGGGDAYEIALRPVERTEEERLQGASDVGWVLEQDGVAVPAPHPVAPLSYLAFLLAAPWEEVLPPPAGAAAYGLDRPRGRITLTPPEGAPLEVVVGAPREDGRAVAHHAFSGCYYLLDAEVSAMLVPKLGELLESAQRVPWDEYLRTRAKQQQGG